LPFGTDSSSLHGLMSTIIVALSRQDTIKDTIKRGDKCVMFGNS
jgi:hypothetical protein